MTMFDLQSTLETAVRAGEKESPSDGANATQARRRITASADDAAGARNSGHADRSHVNNGAVAEGGEHLLAGENNHIKMSSTGWDGALRGRLSGSVIGAVGARLLCPDRTVQHAGMVLGTEGSGAEHEGRGAAASDPGPRGQGEQQRTVPAIMGALLGCRRDLFEQIGGCDALRFGISFSDVDFCLRLRAAGLRVIYEPAIEACHHECKSLVSTHGVSDRVAYVSYTADAMKLRAL
jgi:hypothetical protein